MEVIKEMVEVIEVKDAVCHTKKDFRGLGMGVSKVWVELTDLDTMKKVADAYGVAFIYKKGREYFFRVNETTHYCKQ